MGEHGEGVSVGFHEQPLSMWSQGQTGKASWLWVVIGKFHFHPASQMKSVPLAEAPAARPLYLLGTCIVCSGQSRGYGQAPAKRKMNVLVWCAEELQGHG